MARNGFKVLDSDIHVIEPPDLWLRYIDPEFRDRAPSGLTESGGWPNGCLSLVGPDGVLWGPRMSSSETDTRMTGDQYSKNNVRYKAYGDRGWTGEVQLDGMDAEGIDVAVLYPSRGLYALSTPGMDPRLAAALARAYNNWLYDFCQADPTRLVGAGMISPFDVEDAVSESHRCVRDMGFKGVFLRPNQINNRNWHDPYYEPLWSALEELGSTHWIPRGRRFCVTPGRQAVRRELHAAPRLLPSSGADDDGGQPLRWGCPGPPPQPARCLP